MCPISQHIKIRRSHIKVQNSVLAFCWSMVTISWSRAVSGPHWLKHTLPSLAGSTPPYYLLDTQPRVSCHLSICSCCCCSYYRSIFPWFLPSQKNGKKKNRKRRLHKFSYIRPAVLIYVTYMACGTWFLDPNMVSVSVRVSSRKQDNYEWYRIGNVLCDWRSWGRSLQRSSGR